MRHTSLGTRDSCTIGERGLCLVPQVKNDSFYGTRKTSNKYKAGAGKCLVIPYCTRFCIYSEDFLILEHLVMNVIEIDTYV
jgi:hypothetical protein